MSLQRTIRRSIQRVNHFGRGGRAHLQTQDKIDIHKSQSKITSFLKKLHKHTFTTTLQRGREYKTVKMDLVEGRTQ